MSEWTTRNGRPVRVSPSGWGGSATRTPARAGVTKPDAAPPKSPVTTVCLAEEYIRAPYIPALSGLGRMIPLAEKRTSKATGNYWNVPLADAQAVVDLAGQHGVDVDQSVRDFAGACWATELSATARSTATDLGFDAPAQVRGLTTSLLDMQQVPVLSAAASRVLTADGSAGHRALLVADEPGLGKTLLALSAVRLEGQECARVLVICPTSLTANWQSEMLQHFEFGTFQPWVAQTLTSQPVPPGVDVVVIGWDVLQAWADTLVKWKPDAVIADEGHYAKAGRLRTAKKTQVVKDTDGALVRDEAGNLQMEEVRKTLSGSARASAVLSIGSAVAKNRGLVVALTGTPIVNRPLELLPLLDFIGVLHIFGGSSAYKNRYCGPKQVSTGGGRTAWTYTGASNLLELNARLASSGHYVRRTKQTLVTSGLMKPKYVDGVQYYDYVTAHRPWVIAPSPEEAREYSQAEEELAGFFAERAVEIARDLRTTVDTEKVRKKVAADAAKHLKRIAELRQVTARLKVKYVAAKVMEMAGRGEKVVIAAHHRDIVDLYADTFTGLKIQGDMGVQKIERVKELFNATPVTEHPVLVLSVEAGKTGHTLCKQTLHGVGPACAYMVFAEQIWTPGDETQAQDRIWRIGQDREVRIINALLANTIDLSIYSQRARKRAIVAAALDAVDPDLRSRADSEREGVGVLAQELAYRSRRSR